MAKSVPHGQTWVFWWFFFNSDDFRLTFCSSSVKRLPCVLARRTRRNSTSRRQARLRRRTSSKRQPSRPHLSRTQAKPTARPEPREPTPAGVYNTDRTRAPPIKNPASDLRAPLRAPGCSSQSTRLVDDVAVKSSGFKSPRQPFSFAAFLKNVIEEPFEQLPQFDHVLPSYRPIISTPAATRLPFVFFVSPVTDSGNNNTANK